MEKKYITSSIKSKSKNLLNKLSGSIHKRKEGSARGDHLIRGKEGENMAANYLKKRGYKIVKRNYNCKYGEIDIIALDKDILSFIEIKTRSSRAHIPPEFTVTKQKQGKIKRSAIHYLGKQGIENTDCRFDIVSVTLNKKKDAIILYKNAFE